MPYEEFLDERLFQHLGMNDTTFWPSEDRCTGCQVLQTGAGNQGLEETKIDQLYYPLTDRAAVPNACRRVILHRARYRPFLPDAPECGPASYGKRYLSGSRCQAIDETGRHRQN